jgi:quinol monooxygenase YgiN
MELSEWCAVVHVDIGSRTGLEAVEDAFHALVDGSAGASGTLELVVLRSEGRPNHFELIGRFASEDAYHEHLVTPSNLVFRSTVAPILGSPYEDRLHSARGKQSWPVASLDDFIVVTQVEARPSELESALAAFDALVVQQSFAAGLRGQVALQRHYLPNNLELISVWESPEAFDAHLASDDGLALRSAFQALLLAPADDRRYTLIAGRWALS